MKQDKEDGINDPHCVHCGEYKYFSYGNTYASGTELTCKNCGHIFQYKFKYSD